MKEEVSPKAENGSLSMLLTRFIERTLSPSLFENNSVYTQNLDCWMRSGIRTFSSKFECKMDAAFTRLHPCAVYYHSTMATGFNPVDSIQWIEQERYRQMHVNGGIQGAYPGLCLTHHLCIDATKFRELLHC